MSQKVGRKIVTNRGQTSGVSPPKMPQQAHLSFSNGDPARQAWRTPKWLFNSLDEIFDFTVDACASKNNHLCPVYWTAQNDARLQDWSKHRVFINPPFKQANKFVHKCPEAKCACMVLFCTSGCSNYFHTFTPDYVVFRRGKILFVPPSPNISQGDGAYVYLAIWGDLKDSQLTKLARLGLIWVPK
jgi:phage N-6-adenine-methyltransferase